MHLNFTNDIIQRIQAVTKMTGVIKKKREKGSMVSMFSASEEKYFCFRGLGRFLVNYPEKKKPVVFCFIEGNIR